jgi:hypothetical protein
VNDRRAVRGDRSWLSLERLQPTVSPFGEADVPLGWTGAFVDFRGNLVQRDLSLLPVSTNELLVTPMALMTNYVERTLRAGTSRSFLVSWRPGTPESTEARMLRLEASRGSCR